MSRIACNYSIHADSGSSVWRDGYPALRAPVYLPNNADSTADLKITHVEYETSNATYYINWEVKMMEWGSKWSCAAVGAAINGNFGTGHNVLDRHNNSGFLWTYSQWSETTIAGSGTATSTSSSVQIDCRTMFNGGYSDARWYNGANGYRKIAQGQLNIVAPTLGSPTINNPSISTGTTTASMSISGSAGTNGGSVSFSTTINNVTKDGTNPSWSGLEPHLEYSYKIVATNSLGKTTTKTGTLTTKTPSLPSYSVTWDSIGRTSARMIIKITSNPDNYWCVHYYKPGDHGWLGATSRKTGTYYYTYSNLTPNTTYNNIPTRVGGIGDRDVQSAVLRTVKTICNKPSNLLIEKTASDLNSITVRVNGSGDTNAPITDYRVWWREQGGSSNSYSIGTSTTYKITGLKVDTNYDLAVVATNAGGSTDSGWVKVNSTKLNNPSLATPIASNIKPFSCTISAQGSISPSRTLSYRFSKDGGNTWTSYQSSNTYNWSNLSEETTYSMKVEVKAAHKGVDSTDTTTKSEIIYITTLADQAKVFIKKDGAWLKGKSWLKKDGSWLKIKKVYIKKNGKWIIGQNEVK